MCYVYNIVLVNLAVSYRGNTLNSAKYPIPSSKGENYLNNFIVTNNVLIMNHVQYISFIAIVLAG